MYGSHNELLRQTQTPQMIMNKQGKTGVEYLTKVESGILLYNFENKFLLEN